MVLPGHSLSNRRIFTPLRRDGEASRVHLIEAAEAFLAQHPQEGYCGQQHSGAAATAADEVRGAAEVGFTWLQAVGIGNRVGSA